MRAALFVIAVTVSLTVFAQPVIGPEITSLPSEHITHLNIAVPGVAMAKDRDGVAIAWAQRSGDGFNVINVARIDRRGYVEGSIHELPRYTRSFADAPSIAALPSGHGFTIGWSESTIAVYCQLAADLTPLSPPRVFASSVAATPVIVRSGQETWITAAGIVGRINDDGSLGAQYGNGKPASDITEIGEFPQLVSSQRIATVDDSVCGCARVGAGPFRGLCPCPIFRFTYGLEVVSLFSFSHNATFPFDSEIQPAVLNNGREILVAWFRGSENNGGDVVLTGDDFAKPKVLGPFGPDIGQTRADIATDGSRTLVVWRTAMRDTTHDIIGAIVDAEGNVSYIDIATSESDERDPSIIAIEPGVFLVAYEKVSYGERRIAGRFITFPMKRRAL